MALNSDHDIFSTPSLFIVVSALWTVLEAGCDSKTFFLSLLIVGLTYEIFQLILVVLDPASASPPAAAPAASNSSPAGSSAGASAPAS